MPDNTNAEIKECLELYTKADAFAKQVSEFRREVSIPAHNQLRYAGHHFMQAMASDSIESRTERLRETRSHCKRAMYDAAEAGLTFLIERVELFKQQYKNISISDVMPDIGDIYLLMDNIIETMTQNRIKEISIDEALEKHMQLFNQGIISLRRLHANRDELNKKQEKNLSDRRKFIIKISLTLLAIIISIIALF